MGRLLFALQLLGALAISPLSAQKPTASGPPPIGTFVTGTYDFTTSGEVRYSMHDGDSQSRRRGGTYKDETWVEKSEESSWHLTFSYIGSRPHLQVEIESWSHQETHIQTGATNGVPYRVETIQTETLSARQPSMDYNATLHIGAVKSVTGMRTLPALVMSVDPTFGVDVVKEVKYSYGRSPPPSQSYVEKGMHFNLRNWAQANWERGVLDTMNDHREYQTDAPEFEPWLNIHATWKIHPK